jgi:hypothetical protein
VIGFPDFSKLTTERKEMPTTLLKNPVYMNAVVTAPSLGVERPETALAHAGKEPR